MKLLLLVLISTYLFAVPSEIIHSSISTYIEDRTYTNSIQKNDANTYGIGADVHYNGSEYKATYEYTHADTKQPPLNEDLKNHKIFLRYGYNINQDIKLNLNYLSVLNDNIAITDGGDGYGLGLSYTFNKKFLTNFTQYMVVYDDFNTYQSDLSFIYKTKINGVGLKLSSISKYIKIDEKSKNSFTKNAKNNYFTSGIKLHAHYNTYHFGAGAYFGKRAFSIMNDGFKLQHHAMEFDRTYAIGVGKSISDFILRVQYIYQRAEELPMQNNNVEIDNIRFLLNLKI